MSVRADQRFTKDRPCPICSGYDDATRGRSERCWGFLSDDKEWAHCTRSEHGGQLKEKPGSETFAHKLTGNCACGVRHDARQDNSHPSATRGTGKQRSIVATYDYRRADGDLAFQVVRFDPKSFAQRQPDGNGHWIWGLSPGWYTQIPNGDWKAVKPNDNSTQKQPLRWSDGCGLFIYRYPEIEALTRPARVYVLEGEKDVARAVAAGLEATCNAGGALKWTDLHAQSLKGLDVVIVPDHDEKGMQHAHLVARSLVTPLRWAASVKIVPLPGLPNKGDLCDWLDAGHTAEELEQMADAAPEWTPEASEGEVAPVTPAEKKTLEEVHTIFRKWLDLPDTGALDMALAGYVANHIPGDAVWLLLVGGPGYGKTEQIMPLAKLTSVHEVGTVTEGSLLSGTSKREQAKDAKGGLLPSMGNFGILLLKDFGSILSMNRDTRTAVLAALREVYDGAWTRHVGTDGGRALTWRGKAGLIGGCTPSIDEHHAVMASLGERFVFYRLPPAENDRQRAMAKRALSLPGPEDQMRTELSEAVRGLFANGVPTASSFIRDEEMEFVITLAQFAVKMRGPVTRDTTPARRIEFVPGHEAPTRISKVLAKLYGGLLAIGVEHERAWELIRKTALDSTPQLRRRALEILLEDGGASSTTHVALALHHPTTTVHRVLEDLEAYNLIERTSQSQGLPDLWTVDAWTIAAWAEIGTSPKKSVAVDTHVAEEADTETMVDARGGESEIPPVPMPTDFLGEVGNGHAPGFRVPTGQVPVDRALYDRLLAEGVPQHEALTQAQVGATILAADDDDEVVL